MKNFLKMLRSRRGISQAELARRLNKSRQAVNGFESSTYEPTMDVATQIATILNVPVSAIFAPDIESPIALIAQFETDEERLAFSEELMTISPSDRLQSVILVHEGACPRWDWDPWNKRQDGLPAIAVPCSTKRQFDEMAIWLRKHGCKSLDCAIGMGGYPYIAFFAADAKYARDQLSDWQPENAQPLPSTPALDEFVMDSQTLAMCIQALNDGSDEAIAFAEKCVLKSGNAEYSAHYKNLAKQMKDLRNRLAHGQMRMVRWSSEHSLLIEALHAAEVKARNSDNLTLAKTYFETRRTIEDQANTSRADWD